MIIDPRLLVAGLCLLVIAFALALILRQVRLGRVVAPRLQAAPGNRPMADYGQGGKLEGSTKTIAIIHDFGHPYNHHTDEREYLCEREAFEVLAQIRSVGKDTPIDIILHTPGGSAFASELIAAALKDRPNTTAYVPYCAMSAGTIIALSTEKVVMGRHACLGPIDLQFGYFAADSFPRLLKEKPIQNVEDVTVLLSYLAEKELKTSKQNACGLLNKKHFGNDDACQLTNFLVSGDLPHGEQINPARAKQLGVNVVGDDCPDAVYRMVEARLELLRAAVGSDGLYSPEARLKKP